MRRNGLAHLRLGDSLPFPEGTHFAVRKGLPLLEQILNKAIADISDVERNAISNRWVGVDMELGHRWARAFRWVALLAGAIALILLLVYFHNGSLRRELTERLRIQRELEETRDHLVRLSADQIRILRMSRTTCVARSRASS